MTALKLQGSSANVTGYQLGDCLGRGAFGQVYRGLNWTTGETVAVKQIQLGNIPKSELGEIMSEIDLLKNLKHPNIVKYKGSEKTREYLYIILEYCENGSLQHICKRFGKFPEGLVGVYISQVLSGLIYLHDQGVIHRDIKGANILTTKDGSVKLADFGVATRTGNITEGTVVGSPYWMAPEVIDQSGATTASDVWSVGCVVIELLEGKPPYSFLEPMPALFRIVQDDNPPLPEGASPIVKDFLLHCFQKDFNLRVTARKLSRHPWMVSSRRQLDAMKSGGSIRSLGAGARAGGGAREEGSRNSSNTGSGNGLRNGSGSDSASEGIGGGGAYDEAVKSVQEWNEALKEPPAISRALNARNALKESDGNSNLGGNANANAIGTGSLGSNSNSNGNQITLKATSKPHHHHSPSHFPPTLRKISGLLNSNLNLKNQINDGSGNPSGNLSQINQNSFSSTSNSDPQKQNKDYGNPSGNKTPTRKTGRVFSRPLLSSVPGLHNPHSNPNPTSTPNANPDLDSESESITPQSRKPFQNPTPTGFGMRGEGISPHTPLAHFQGPESPQTSFQIQPQPQPHPQPQNQTQANLSLISNAGRAAPAPSLIDQRKYLEQLQRPEDLTDNWDDDFEEGIDTFKIARLEKSSEEKGEKEREKEKERKKSTSSTLESSRRDLNENNKENSNDQENEDRDEDQDEWDQEENEENENAKTIRPFSRNQSSSTKIASSNPSSNASSSASKFKSIGKGKSSKEIAPVPSVSLPSQIVEKPSPKEQTSGNLETSNLPLKSKSSSNLSSSATHQSLPSSSTSSNLSSSSSSSASISTSNSFSKPPKVIDDYSDLVSDEEEGHLDERIRNLRLKNSIGRRLFHPNDLKSLASSASSSSLTSSASKNPTSSKERVDLATESNSASNANLNPKRNSIHQRGSSSPGTSTLNVKPSSSSSSSSLKKQVSSSNVSSPSHRSMSPTAAMVSPPGSRNNSFKAEKEKSHQKVLETRQSLGKYSEGKEDWSDVFGDEEASTAAIAPGIDDPMDAPTLQLTTRLSNRSWLGDADGDEDDPFAEIDEEEFAQEADLEANVARDKHARMCSHIVELVEALVPNAPEEELTEACEQLDVILTDMPEMKTQVMSSHGALAIIQLLEVTRLRDVICRLLGLLNLIIFEDPGAQENLCLIGAIPVVMSFTTKKFPHEVRLEAAHFVFTMCSTSSLTLQFVLSCRGLKTLVELIDEDYNEQKDLVWLGVACVNSVLELQSPASRNDFCRMLAQEGLLEPLSTALISVVQDTEDEFAESAQAHILHTFLIYSQSDSWLKKKVATRGVLRRMLQSCPLLEPQSLTLMLKVIKNLSMSPVILDELQNCNAIEILTRILAENYDKEHGTEMSNQILTAMYNLCRLNKSRQEEAAQAGIIPQLLRVAQTSSPLKQFALPILCDFAHAGKPTRKTFWQHSGLSFYLKLLEDPYWQVSALESILVWLTDETARVEDVLLRPSSIDSLLYVFTTAKANSFENLLEPFLKILRLSNGITTGIAKFPSFFRRLIDRLKHQKAVVRLNLLRIAKLVCDVHPERQGLIEHYGLIKIIDELSQKDGAILVRELAREILAQRYMQPEPPIAKSVRRSTSESNVSLASASSLMEGARTPPSIPSPTRKTNLPPNPLLENERDKSSSGTTSSNLSSNHSTSSPSGSASNASNSGQTPQVIRKSPSRSMFSAPPRRPTTGRTRDFSDS